MVFGMKVCLKESTRCPICVKKGLEKKNDNTKVCKYCKTECKIITRIPLPEALQETGC